MVSLPALADVITGNDLAEACAGGTDFQAAFCAGYTIGVLEGVKYAAFAVFVAVEDGTGTANAGNEFVDAILRFCVPEQAHYGQIQAVFVKYLQDNPAERHNTARFLFLQSMRNAFPCPD